MGTYEQTIGTLNQTSSTRDLTVTDALLWSGGTLGDTDDGADVTVSGAAGLIDPPDTGSMQIASTLNVVSGAVVTMVSGTVDFIGGSGMYINGQVKASPGKNVDVTTRNAIPNKAGVIVIASGENYTVVTRNVNYVGHQVSELPILNQGGQIYIGGGI